MKKIVDSITRFMKEHNVSKILLIIILIILGCLIAILLFRDYPGFVYRD